MMCKVNDIGKIKKIMRYKKFSFHKCSMCGYHCGYIYKGDNLYYDSGCDCTYQRGGWQPRPPEDILEFFKMNPNIDYDYIKEHLC